MTTQHYKIDLFAYCLGTANLLLRTVPVMKDKKVKQVRAIMPISVPGIWNFADMGPIERKVNTYIDSILPRINIEDISGWRLLLHINSVCSDLISVYKKFLRYPSDREYVIYLPSLSPIIRKRLMACRLGEMERLAIFVQ
ncbi:hypothetical protein AXE65_11265 [Ventosimonas gracilis]|uniref:Uncharacterized protein n=1 Tax=Ventosimonas gracilis TaxID=1680762 RepID=A0A139SWA2_9GAMM|nr:Imm9 family immunity protein [Ventosimonas gracilis]KXU38887.1 hypothetical protein AXE65_11265 [Ventosimonas gracilis]